MKADTSVQICQILLLQDAYFAKVIFFCNFKFPPHILTMVENSQIVKP